MPGHPGEVGACGPSARRLSKELPSQVTSPSCRDASPWPPVDAPRWEGSRPFCPRCARPIPDSQNPRTERRHLGSRVWAGGASWDAPDLSASDAQPHLLGGGLPWAREPVRAAAGNGLLWLGRAFPCFYPERVFGTIAHPLKLKLIKLRIN